MLKGRSKKRASEDARKFPDSGEEVPILGRRKTGSETVLHAEGNHRRGSADTVDGACCRGALAETVIAGAIVVDAGIDCVQRGAFAQAVVIAQAELVRAGIRGRAMLAGLAIGQLDGIHAHLVFTGQVVSVVAASIGAQGTDVVVSFLINKTQVDSVQRVAQPQLPGRFLGASSAAEFMLFIAKPAVQGTCFVHT